jgi:hypothetical protein
MSVLLRPARAALPASRSTLGICVKMEDLYIFRGNTMVQQLIRVLASADQTRMASIRRLQRLTCHGGRWAAPPASPPACPAFRQRGEK